MNAVRQKPFRRTQYLIPGVLVCTSVLGVFELRGYNPLPVASLLDAAVLCTALIFGLKIPRGGAVPFFVAAAYVSLKTLISFSLGGDLSVFSYVQATKAFLFLVPLAFIAAHQILERSVLARTVKIIMPFFATKYAISVAFGIHTVFGARPGLLDENNFEMAILIGLVYLAYEDMGRFRFLWLVGLSAVVLLSASRSAVIELAIMYAFTFIRADPRRLFLALFAAAAGASSILYVFRERAIDGGGLQTLDRYKFFTVFREQTSSWSALHWFTGNLAIKPLSNSSCEQLQYYAKLFSNPASGTCYSVVLHAYALRILIDHGILGCLILGYCIIKLLRVSGSTVRDIAFIVTLALANGLSVSSFNSEFVMLVVFVAVLRERRDEPALVHNAARPNSQSTINNNASIPSNVQLSPGVVVGGRQRQSIPMASSVERGAAPGGC